MNDDAKFYETLNGMGCCNCGYGDCGSSYRGNEVDWLTNGSVCRSSDYRIFANDPQYDVISTIADVLDEGYFILSVVKA